MNKNIETSNNKNKNIENKEKDMYIESVLDMMKSMNKSEKRRIYKLTLYIYNKKNE